MEQKIKIELKNLGTINTNEVRIITSKGKISLYFSYETIVSFYSTNYSGTIENLWKTTTGKFLNKFEPNKEYRLTEDQFNKKLEMAMKEVF